MKKLLNNYLVLFIILIILIITFIFSTNKINTEIKSIELALDKKINTFNYLRTTNTSDMEQINQFMEGLFSYDNDNKLITKGAESYKVSDDKLIYNIKLKNNIFWEDGSPVKADDYIFSWQENLLNKKSLFPFILFPIYNAKDVYNGIKTKEELGIKKNNDYELEIRLQEPYNAFLYGLANCSTFPIKKEFYETVGAENFGTDKTRILCNGPYIIENCNFSSEINYIKNPKYWDVKNVRNNNIKCKILQEEITKNLLFDSKEISLFKSDSNSYEKYKNKDCNIIGGLSNKITYLYMSGNTKENNKYFKDLNLRKCISKAIDRRILVEKLLQDNSIQMNRLIPNYLTDLNIKYYDLEYIDNNFMYNLEEAKILWNNFLQNNNINKLEISIYFPSTDDNKKILENIKDQLEKNINGLTVNLKEIANSSYSQVLRKEGVSCGIQTWTSTFPDPESYLQIFDKNSYFNYAKYNDDNFQQFYEKAKCTANRKEQYELFKNAEKIASDSYMIIPLYMKYDNYILNKKIKNFSYKSTSPNVYYKDIEYI